MQVAILDDYQNVALRLADWSGVRRHAEITVFNDHVADPSAVVERLRPFAVVCVMRERTPLTREILRQLPNLKLIASTGPRNAAIDSQAAADLGIAVTATGYDSTPTIEFTWSLILASIRGVDREAASLKAGGWQMGLGSNLRGKSLGVVGLGNIGREVARVGLAFGMKVIAWSQNLTEEKASAAGAILVDKQTLFREADVVTVHLVLSDRTRGLIGAPEFALMKPAARFVNTSRGPIVDEAALIEALQARRIAGAAVDVFDMEPLPPDHPFRKLDNVLATPHIGYVTEDLYRTFYGDAADRIATWLASVRVSVTVNGHARTIMVEPRMTLLDALREELALTGTKKGCDRGECGACTVHIEGRRVLSCMALAAMQDGKRITTIEGLEQDGVLHPLQAAFIEHDGFQCGFCTSGQIMSGVAVIEEATAGWPSAATADVTKPCTIADLSSAEIRERMSGNLCRCACYPNIVDAVAAAAGRI